MHPGHTNNGFYSEKRLHRDDAGIHPVALGRGQTVQRVPQTAEPLLELQNLVRGELVQADGILNAVICIQGIVRLVVADTLGIGRLVADAGSESLGHIVSNLNIFVLGVPVVKVAQVDDSHYMYLHIVFCGRVAANDMEGGGERHPGEPPRTLGLFVPKPGKQKTLARQNTTQAHKVKL